MGGTNEFIFAKTTDSYEIPVGKSDLASGICPRDKDAGVIHFDFAICNWPRIAHGSPLGVARFVAFQSRVKYHRYRAGKIDISLYRSIKDDGF
jgi:hypothetical protein